MHSNAFLRPSLGLARVALPSLFGALASRSTLSLSFYLFAVSLVFLPRPFLFFRHPLSRLATALATPSYPPSHAVCAFFCPPLLLSFVAVHAIADDVPSPRQISSRVLVRSIFMFPSCFSSFSISPRCDSRLACVSPVVCPCATGAKPVWPQLLVVLVWADSSRRREQDFGFAFFLHRSLSLSPRDALCLPPQVSCCWAPACPSPPFFSRALPLVTFPFSRILTCACWHSPSRFACNSHVHAHDALTATLFFRFGAPTVRDIRLVMLRSFAFSIVPCFASSHVFPRFDALRFDDEPSIVICGCASRSSGRLFLKRATCSFRRCRLRRRPRERRRAAKNAEPVVAHEDALSGRLVLGCRVESRQFPLRGCTQISNGVVFAFAKALGLLGGGGNLHRFGRLPPLLFVCSPGTCHETSPLPRRASTRLLACSRLPCSCPERRSPPGVSPLAFFFRAGRSCRCVRSMPRLRDAKILSTFLSFV